MEEKHGPEKKPGRNLVFDFADETPQVAKIRVVGVGGAGGNAINRMIDDGLNGVDFIAVNTDLQALEQNKASCRIQIGKESTRGLGAGGVPEMGRKAILENKDIVVNNLADSEMVFITSGMGGGTGTGAAPVVAQIAKDLGALTVGIVTKPFTFEGAKRMEKAERGLQELKEAVDTLIVVPNQKLISLVPPQTPVEEAFRVADEILMHATKGISDLINIPGLVNLDFADVQTIMSDMGDAIMGSGMASGENRAQTAAEEAISSPLIDDVSISGAIGVLVNITGGKDMAISDINEATSIIYNEAGPEANLIFGAVIDPAMEGKLRVTVIATGFSRNGLRSHFYGENQQTQTVSKPLSDLKDVPAVHQFETEPLEETLGEILGQDSGLDFSSKDDLNVPTFIRKQMD
jgi:cell division protein FtsZ